MESHVLGGATKAISNSVETINTMHSKIMTLSLDSLRFDNFANRSRMPALDL